MEMGGSWRVEEMVLEFRPSLAPSERRRGIVWAKVTFRLSDLKIQLFDFQQEDLSRPSWSFVGPTVRRVLCGSDVVLMVWLC